MILFNSMFWNDQSVKKNVKNGAKNVAQGRVFTLRAQSPGPSVQHHTNQAHASYVSTLRVETRGPGVQGCPWLDRKILRYGENLRPAWATWEPLWKIKCHRSSTMFCTLHKVPVPLLQFSTVYTLTVMRYSHKDADIWTAHFVAQTF